MSGPYFILAVVDGPSEALATSVYQERSCDGALIRILAYACTAYADEIRKYVYVQHWRSPIPASHLRGGKALVGYAEKANRWIRQARVVGHYMMVLFLVDNDRFTDTPSRQQQLVNGIQAALNAEEPTHRPIVVEGVAIEMIESWLLADPALLAPSHELPRGKRSDEFWGNEKDSDSHHPKCLLRQHVCKPRNWCYAECIQHWDIAAATKNSPSLRIFVDKILVAATSLGLR